MATTTALTAELLQTQLVPQLLAALPVDWRGTTFNNSEAVYVGRTAFSERLQALLEAKAADPTAQLGEQGAISTADLSALGNAEDYFRVASNVSVAYEHLAALDRRLPVAHVWSFASSTMPFVAVALASDGPVHLYCGDAPPPFTPAQCATLARLGGDLTCHGGAPSSRDREAVLDGRDGGVVATVLVLDSACGGPPTAEPGDVDGIVDTSTGMLCIVDPARIRPASIMTVRKRLATPITTPAALAALERYCGLETALDGNHGNDALEIDAPSAVELATFNAHLQTMSGTPANPAAEPVTCAAGLPAIAALWFALKASGGADVLLCSTCYGGSSELTDLVLARGEPLRKATFDIQGSLAIDAAIAQALGKLAADPASLKPTTVLFVEIPTNPDQKIPNLAKLVATVQTYEQTTGKSVLLLVDTTFAPASEVLGKLAALAPSLEAMVFCSLSKSVSRGTTTAGTLVANHTPGAQAWLAETRDMAALLDTTARKDQLQRLCANHEGVEARCAAAYQVTVQVGDALQAAVQKHAGVAMPLTYVLPTHAAQGFTSSTFSFNLPAPAGCSAETSAQLAQVFVDALCEDASLFKPCVSFGQDNGLVYCTVPATSTQGALRAEDKAKQAVGGVQLARLSFSPTLDVAAVVARIQHACNTIYGRAPAAK
jgi:cysteine synthase A